MTYRSLLLDVAGAALLLVACGKHHAGDGTDAAIDGTTQVACTDPLTCFQVDCSVKGLPPTSVSGYVHAPNGTLPLFGINVYVPDTDPGPLMPGVQCGQCSLELPGNPITTTTTDETGHFSLTNVPATANVPIVIQVGKWRKQIKLPAVAACQDTPLPVIDTDLPASGSATGGDIVSVDLPQIAITTGAADALECLARKLGIADSEFTTDAGSGHVHLYNGNGTDHFVAGFNGVATATAFNNATTLWANSGSAANAATDAAKLDNYDLMFFSCESGQHPETKSQQALENVLAYANLGGRIFMSHWHNIWIGGDMAAGSAAAAHNNPDWKAVANWNFGDPQTQDSVTTLVDNTTTHGMSYETWLENVGASPTPDEVAITQARYTCSSLNDPTAERFIYVDPNLSPGNGEKESSVTDFEFTTDVTMPVDQRCGKVVFSDMHVSATSLSLPGAVESTTGTQAYPFPTGCDTHDLTPQEKALAFIFFDIASCIGPIS